MKKQTYYISKEEYYTNEKYIGSSQLNKVQPHNIINFLFKLEIEKKRGAEEKKSDPILKGLELHRLLQNRLADDLNVDEYEKDLKPNFERRKTGQNAGELKESEILVNDIFDFCYSDIFLYICHSVGLENKGHFFIEKPFGVVIDDDYIFRAKPDLMFQNDNTIILYDFKCTSKNNPFSYKLQANLYNAVLSVHYPNHTIINKYILIPSTKELTYIQAYDFEAPANINQFFHECKEQTDTYFTCLREPIRCKRNILIRTNN